MAFESISYHPEQAGWARLLLTGPHGTWEWAVSYVGNDPLHDLVDMALALLKGAHQAQTVFMGEPGECVWWVGGERDMLHCEWREFADWASRGLIAEDDHEVVACGSASRSGVVRQIHDLLAHISRDAEACARLKESGAPFPHEGFQRLAHLLARSSNG